MIRVKCPKCDTTITGQTNKTVIENDKIVTIAFFCRNCKSSFRREFTN